MQIVTLNLPISNCQCTVGKDNILILNRLSHNFIKVILTNLTLDKVCNINLNLSSVVCANIQAHDQEQVQRSCHQTSWFLWLHIKAINIHASDM